MKTNLLKQQNLIAAGMIGNIIEVYDMGIYGLLAPFIAYNFFPRGNLTASLISTFGVFFIGFLSRPLGAIIFGHIGDTVGRKQALVLSIVLMAIATAIVGVLPNFYQAGAMAGILLIVARLFQGLSVGGEYTGSVVLLVESAPEGQRGLYGSFAMMGSNLGTLIASFACWLLTLLLSHHVMMSWGWRIPFLLALIGGALGMYFRYRIQETQVFSKTRKKERSKAPIIETFSNQFRELLLTLCLTWLGVVATYMIFVYVITYMTQILHYNMLDTLTINTCSVAVLVCLIPLAGWASDIFGRRPIMILGASGLLLLITPYFYILSLGSVTSALFMQMLMTLPAACFFGVTPVAMAEMMPTRLRYSATAFGYNVGAAIFGGTTPLIATLLIHYTHNNSSPSFYLIICALITICACLIMKETQKQPFFH